ncbi:MAG: DUF3667 domain-containing protein [Niastella sp.]|nr:DUF3667 domain-containing protein [Niastella sp.]
MHSTNCLNCNTSLQPEQRYCSQCGQQAAIHRFSIPHFLHEFFHAFTHTDKGIFHLLKSLATRPGTTAREYIQGKRKAYFNPFTFFLIVMAIYVLVDPFYVKAVPAAEPDQRVLARIPTAEGREKYVSILHRANEVRHFLTAKANIVAMVAVPFFALISWLFYYRRGFNFAEHLTANMMFVVFSNLVLVVLIFPLKMLFKNGPFGAQLPYLGMLLQIFYLWWCYNGFYQLQLPGARIKSFLVSAFGISFWFVFSLTMVAIYIYQSWDFYKFFGRMFGGGH